MHAGTGKDACPTLSIADGKKRFGGFRFVFMEIRSVIEKIARQDAKPLRKRGAQRVWLGGAMFSSLSCRSQRSRLCRKAWSSKGSRRSDYIFRRTRMVFRRSFASFNAAPLFSHALCGRADSNAQLGTRLRQTCKEIVDLTLR
jgi:hypothetical protein